MKKLKFLITLSLFISLSYSFAQSKVAHIDTQKLISEMPEVIAKQKELSLSLIHISEPTRPY